jgi:transcriptional regulator NrdR family protein
MASLTVYLAGPYNNCNKRQQAEWRKQIKKELGASGYKWIDPADHTNDWTPLKEMVDIERSDLVIANLWRESIGTVVGIVQATRSGKPVILIDPNYIGSAVLEDLVGKDKIVHTIPAAVHKLENEVAPQLQIDIQVEKKTKTLQPFNHSKLQRSLNSVCSESQISDALLPVLVSHRVRNRIKAVASSGIIQASKIVDLVFEELDKLVTEPDGRYTDNLEKHARMVREQWRRQKSLKDEARILEDLSKKELEYRRELDRLIEENRQLRLSLRGVTDETRTSASKASFESVSEAVKAASTRFAESLVFHDKALASAADCPFVRVDDVYEALDLLAQYAKMCNEESDSSKTSRPTGLKEWLRERGSPIEYAPNESKSVRSDARAQSQRSAVYMGEEYALNKHLKLGVGSANECCRIHFELLRKPSGFKILIGHVGRHL